MVGLIVDSTTTHVAWWLTLTDDAPEPVTPSGVTYQRLATSSYVRAQSHSRVGPTTPPSLNGVM